MIFVYVVVAAITLMRIIAAYHVPLTGDEAYYWEWSRHLAFGYVDHPPMVAWTIALFSPFGLTPGAIRLGFVLCGLIATLAGAAAATDLAGGDRRAGAVTAVAFSLTPLFSLAFGSATPDGPYLAAWTVSLWLTVRAFKSRRPIDFALLGVAMGIALLTRFFAAALVFGIAMYALAPTRRVLWQAGLWIAFAVGAVVYAPFIVWNAQHDWVTFDFTFVGRHVRHLSWKGAFTLYAINAGAYSPGLWIGAIVCAIRPRSALLAWTSLPLLGLLTLLAFIEPVEIHWVFGPYASLCIALGLAYVKLSSRMRVVWACASVVPALILVPMIFVAAVAPGPIYQAFRNTGSSLRNTGPFEIFTFWPLAQDVRKIADKNDAVVMTDGYGLSALLDFNAGVAPVVIGYNWQGRESRRWYPASNQPKRALFVDKETLASRPDFAARLALVCARVVPAPSLSYSYAGVPPRAYYLTWCEGMKPEGIRRLRWEVPGEEKVATVAPAR